MQGYKGNRSVPPLTVGCVSGEAYQNNRFALTGLALVAVLLSLSRVRTCLVPRRGQATKKGTYGKEKVPSFGSRFLGGHDYCNLCRHRSGHRKHYHFKRLRL